jgi:L-seryl-tRNA(Ser) seleniumtransferase
MWLNGEPAARQSLAAGAALITFSADKLMGGPQAGIIAGRADLVRACAAHPLARALRPGGLVLAALHRTALAYLDKSAEQTIPFWHMAAISESTLTDRANQITNVTNLGQVVSCSSLPGAGSVPGASIPSVGIAINGDHAKHLRECDPPIIARVKDNQTILDLRTVDPTDDPVLIQALSALASTAG